MHDQFSAALQLLPNYLGQHTLLCAAALTLGVSLALPLAFLAARRPRIRFWVLSMTGLFQTIPGLALLAMFYPLLLGLSDVARALVGIDIPALGFLPSVAALTLYSMMPIVRNGIAGFVGIDPAVLEAADAVGMTPRQRFLRVEAPLAAPVVMAGIRTAAVWTIGTATLSTSVGQTSLGNYIFSGLQTQNWVFVLFGCVAAAVLATVVDQLLGLIETGLSAGKRGLIGLGTAGLALGLASRLFRSARSQRPAMSSAQRTSPSNTYSRNSYHGKSEFWARAPNSRRTSARRLLSAPSPTTKSMSTSIIPERYGRM